MAQKEQLEGGRDWLGLANPPRWNSAIWLRNLGGFLMMLAGLAFILLFFLALIAAFSILITTTDAWCHRASVGDAAGGGGKGVNLGSDALIAAALGARLG